jgi:hypothetical protein
VGKGVFAVPTIYVGCTMVGTLHFAHPTKSRHAYAHTPAALDLADGLPLLDS